MLRWLVPGVVLLLAGCGPHSAGPPTQVFTPSSSAMPSNTQCTLNGTPVPCNKLP